jgi:hypothetical protein
VAVAVPGCQQDFVELKGDGCVASDRCIKGGLARIGPKRVVVIGCGKGHTPQVGAPPQAAVLEKNPINPMVPVTMTTGDDGRSNALCWGLGKLQTRASHTNYTMLLA